MIILTFFVPPALPEFFQACLLACLLRTIEVFEPFSLRNGIFTVK